MKRSLFIAFLSYLWDSPTNFHSKGRSFILWYRRAFICTFKYLQYLEIWSTFFLSIWYLLFLWFVHICFGQLIYLKVFVVCYYIDHAESSNKNVSWEIVFRHSWRFTFIVKGLHRLESVKVLGNISCAVHNYVKRWCLEVYFCRRLN